MLKVTDPPASQLLRPPVLLGSLFLSGFAPVLRGTSGSLVAAGLAVGLFYIPGATPLAWVGGAVAFSVLSFLVGRQVLKDPALGKDPGWFVLDEAAGLFLTLALIPAGSLLDIFAGLLTFRFYDIAKPWPVRSFERLPGSLGILTDDLAAAVFAAWTVWAFRVAVPGLM
ncbi:MAG: phosphatidylglycerophosphatase A [Planctomycetes bacterium]|nr:phosphatidylglycerophosphatase A [Planctomycetota bacterium]